MDSVVGKTAVVTGGASGMGRAFARRFLAAGMNVVVADIEEPVLEKTVAELKGMAVGGAGVMGVVTDVSVPDAVRSLATLAIGTFGRVNVLCNNAGVGGQSLTATPGQVELGDWRWVMGVNFWGVVHGHAAFLPHLLEHGDGHIVNTASMAGHFPGHSAYAASKWAVVSITEGLYTSLRASGSTLGVSCLCPGWTNTNIGDSIRNRPDWAAPATPVQADAPAAARHQYVVESVAAGLAPDAVAELVFDAIVEERFWIFTHPSMVEDLEIRFRAIREGLNPTLGLDALND